MYRWLEHTSEQELWIEDVSPEAVLGEALIALGDLLGEHWGGEPLTHRISLSASDLPTLLVDWLGELARLAETDGFIPERVVEMELVGANLDAVVGGQRSQHQTPVKGVTYRRLEFDRDGEGDWHARVVLNV